MEPVHPQFKEGLTLGLFFGVVLFGLFCIALQTFNSWYDSSYRPDKVWTRGSASCRGSTVPTE